MTGFRTTADPKSFATNRSMLMPQRLNNNRNQLAIICSEGRRSFTRAPINCKSFMRVDKEIVTLNLYHTAPQLCNKLNVLITISTIFGSIKKFLDPSKKMNSVGFRLGIHKIILTLCPISLLELRVL